MGEMSAKNQFGMVIDKSVFKMQLYFSTINIGRIQHKNE